MYHAIEGTDLVAITMTPDQWVCVLLAIVLAFSLACSFAHYCGKHSD